MRVASRRDAAARRLGSGWDFSHSNVTNQGLTLCGGNADHWMSGYYGVPGQYYYPSVGAACPFGRFPRTRHAPLGR